MEIEATDGRPCQMDVFVTKLFEEVDDHYDRAEAIEAWLKGDWDGAIEWLSDESAAAIRVEPERASDDFARLFRVPGIGQVLVYLDENDEEIPCCIFRIPDHELGRLQLGLSQGGGDYDQAEQFAREILEKLRPEGLADAVKPLTDMKQKLDGAAPDLREAETNLGIGHRD